MEFRFFMPVKTFFGRGCIEKNFSEFALLGKKGALITGKSSAEKNGSLADVASALRKLEIPFVLYNNIGTNPSVEEVRNAAGFIKKNGADFIIAIGGGSPLDAAKAAAILAVNDINDEELFSGNYPEKPLPIAAIPTTAGTGSEVTPYSILTYRKISNKKSIASDSIFPAVAFLDPYYTESLPPGITINTAIDALSHAVEGYLSFRANDSIRPYALESIRLSGECLPLLNNEEITPDIREKLLYSSMLAGAVIAHTGTTIVHSMGYPLTYYRNIDHGRANGLLLYDYLKYIGSDSEKVKEIIASAGLKSVDEMGALLKKLLGDFEELSADEIELFTGTATASKNVSNTVPRPSEVDIRTIYENTFKK